MRKFYLPYSEKLHKLNEIIINLMEEKPHCFNGKITAVYGSMPGMVWNGGRFILSGLFVSSPKMENIIDFYNNNDIDFRFTFSNNNIVESDIYDRYCNAAIEILSKNGRNGVIINSSLLEKYLRKNYDNLYYVSSITKDTKDIDTFNSLIEKYDMAVLNYHLNKDLEYLEKISRKDKVEILVDVWCNDTCKNNFACWNDTSKSIQDFTSGYNKFGCTAYEKNFIQNINVNKNVVINPGELDFYEKLDFSNFKLEGRTGNIVDVAFSYAYYLALSEYKDEILNDILRRLIMG